MSTAHGARRVGGHQRLIPVSFRFFAAVTDYLENERPAGADTDRGFVVVRAIQEAGPTRTGAVLTRHWWRQSAVCLYPPEMSFPAVPGVAASADDYAPQLADVGRYGRYLVRRFVSTARAVDQPTFRSVLAKHHGGAVHDLPVTVEQWPAYEHVNVQGALDVVLQEYGDRARLIGVAGHRHHGPFGIADLLGGDPVYAMRGARPGNITRISLPSGPGGQTRECLRVAVVLLEDEEERIAVLFRGPDPESGSSEVTLQIIANRPAGSRRRRNTDVLRRLRWCVDVRVWARRRQSGNSGHV